jgi:glycosyltransferase involved in cell wall biosynthesis
MSQAMSESRPKIGFDIREAVRAQPRGIGVYQGHVVEALGRQDADFDFVFYHERPREGDWPEIPAQARRSRLEMKGGRFHTWERIALPLRLLGDGIALYHGTFNTLPPRPWPLRGPKLVATIHDLIVTWLDENLDDPYVRYVRKVMPRVVRQSDAIVTISEFSKQDILQRYDAKPEHVHVVHNGLHPRFYEDPPRARIEELRGEYAQGRPYLMAIGALLDRKNCDALFPMLAALTADGTLGDAVLVMTGLAGEALERRRRAAEAAGVLDRVRFYGYLDWDELHALFAGAELFVYPSLYEGWGIPIVEALACGTPVATSNRTSMPEAGGDWARYFDPEDAESIRETVRQAWQERAAFRERRGEAQTWARAFSYDEHARRLLEIYGELLA